MRPARLRLTADGRFGGRRSRNCLERSVAASGRTLALVRGGEFDPPPLIGAGTAARPSLQRRARVRKQRHIPRAFDRLGDLPLLA